MSVSANYLTFRSAPRLQNGRIMSTIKILYAAVLFIGLSGSAVWADCNISDSKIEEAILQKPEFRDPLNRQMVRDLRSWRDSAYVL